MCVFSGVESEDEDLSGVQTLQKVYRKFVKLIYAISTLLFLVARKASRRTQA